MTVTTTSISSVSVVEKTVVVIGQAKVNGAGDYQVVMTATDNGTSGTPKDTFGLQVIGAPLTPPISFVPVGISTGSISQ